MYSNCLFPRLWRHKFWREPYLSNQVVFSTWPKSEDKNLIILRKKGAFTMKKSIFHHFWRAIIKANKKFFLEGESLTLTSLLPSTRLFALRRRACLSMVRSKHIVTSFLIFCLACYSSVLCLIAINLIIITLHFLFGL